MSDYVMDHVFWIGLYPGLGEEEIAYMVDTVDGAVRACGR
jgi:CDP-6-deoxy-D-xylo-4-hexulose-3-dehydrase